MKIRFGALALMAALAACTGQDRTMTGDAHKGGRATAARSAVGPAVAGYSKDSQRTLGNAPDRGELLTYKKGAAVLHKGAYTLRPIALSEEHAIRGVATGMMTIPAPDGGEIKIRYQRHEESPDGNWSWIGRVVGGDQGREAIITFGEHAVFGSIPQANGPSLQLTTERGIAYLVQADAARLSRGIRAGGDAKVPTAYGASSAHETESLVASAAQKIQAKALAGSPKAVPAANTIDLVAGYSNGLATRLGGASVAVTKLTNLVAAANAALLNSNVNGKIRLVSALQVSYADNTDNGTALDELTGNDGTSPVTVPAALAPLRTARETYGADLVTLVRDFKQENNGCGIAWLIGSNQQPITIAGDAPFAYSVVSEGSYQNGTSTLYCEDITLAHELAHNMGSAHDKDKAPDPGRYPYSYGYKTTAAAGNFFTVMAYGEDNQTLYRVFSNPLITTCGGLACGVADQADNARSLNQTIPVVATFRATVVPIKQRLYADYNGDGLSDAVWRNSTSGENIVWWSANADTRAQLGFVPGPTWQIVAAGDFGGDGLSDLFWRNSATGENIIWRSASAANLQQVQTVADASWRVAGSGDFDGDGKYDIFWRNSATGANIIWWSGVFAGNTSVQTVPVAWTIAGIGDFNNDGQSDVFWRNPANGENIIWFSANPASILYAQAVVGAAWQVVGTGDFNGDGKSDLFWRNSTSGVNIIWWSGSFNNASGVATVANSWKVVATGDYNGDGLYDLLWRNSVSGENSIWFSATPASFWVLPLIADQSWQIKP